MQEFNSDKALRHLTQTLLSQVVDVNNHIRSVQDNAEMEEKDKIALTNFANYHLTVLSILLNDVKEFARANFENAFNILDWAAQHYKLAYERKAFTPCKCIECPQELQPSIEEVEKDKEILDDNSDSL